MTAPTADDWRKAFAHAAGCQHPPIYVDTTKAPDYPPAQPDYK